MQVEALEARTLLATGAADPGFSSDGTRTYRFTASQADVAAVLAHQADSSIIAITYAHGRNGSRQLALSRYNADGSLDSSFGDGGRAITRFSLPDGDHARWGPSTTTAHALRVQPDGKVVVGGGRGSHFAVFRFNADGSPDPTFSGDGVQSFKLSEVSHSFATDLDVLPDGSILAGGSGNNPGRGANRRGGDFTLIRLRSDGSPDPSFGGDGIVHTNFGGLDHLNDIAMDGSGNILAVGVRRDDRMDFARMALARYRPDGSPDPTFGAGGKVITNLAGDIESLSSVHPLSGGGFYAAGDADGDAVLLRYTPAGRRDRSFDGDGVLRLDLGSARDRASILQGSPRRLTLLGTATPPTDVFGRLTADPRQFAITVRLTNPAAPAYAVRPFGIDTAGTDTLGDAVLLPDGQLLALLTSTTRDQLSNSYSSDAVLARFKPGGVPDGGFGRSGSVTIDLEGPMASAPLQVVGMPDGKSLVLVMNQLPGRTIHALLRLLPDGSPDPAFGRRGRAVLRPRGNDGAYTGFALGEGGKILIVGTAPAPDGHSALGVSRLNADGSPDASFGHNGRVWHTDAQVQDPRSIHVLPDGKLLVGGRGPIYSAPLSLVRLHANGSIDTSFGRDGFLSASLFGSYDASRRILLHGDGRFTLVGASQRELCTLDPPPPTLIVRRFKPDGSLDASFSEDGTLSLPGGWEAKLAHDARLLPDGDLLVLAAPEDGPDGASRGDFRLIRLNPDGSVGSATHHEVPGALARVFFDRDGAVIALTDAATVRLKPDATPDPGHDPGPPVSPLQFSARAITPEGSLLTAGSDGDGDLILSRYLLSTTASPATTLS